MNRMSSDTRSTCHDLKPPSHPWIYDVYPLGRPIRLQASCQVWVSTWGYSPIENLGFDPALYRSAVLVSLACRNSRRFQSCFIDGIQRTPSYRRQPRKVLESRWNGA